MKLIKYDAMCHAIEVCHKVDEVKEIREQAKVMEAYAKMATNTEAERKAIEIRLRAERKAGQLLTKMAEIGERAGRGGNQKATSHRTSMKLKDLGITWDQSSNWQKLGKIPQQAFDRMLGTDKKPTTKGLVRETYIDPDFKKLIEGPPVSEEAIWLWGRLRDFRTDILPKSQKAVLRTMTDNMKKDVFSLAPKVATWLQELEDYKDD